MPQNVAENHSGAAAKPSPRKRLPGLREFRLLANGYTIIHFDGGLCGDSYLHIPLTEYAPTAHAAELLAKAKLRRLRPDLDWSVVPA